jgi:hypothetical protein
LPPFRTSRNEFVELIARGLSEPSLPFELKTTGKWLCPKNVSGLSVSTKVLVGVGSVKM